MAGSWLAGEKKFAGGSVEWGLLAKSKPAKM